MNESGLALNESVERSGQAIMTQSDSRRDEPLFSSAPPEPLAGTGPRFIVTVDTEEEFDWNAPFDAASRRVTHIDGLLRFQQFADEYGIRPIYLVDYPVVMNDRAAAAIGEICADGRGDAGMHLHPWVTPPHDEATTRANSYAGNLPPALERAKLTTLKTAFEQRIGVPALLYRAGRYGIGNATAAILADLGVCIDSSIRPHFDYGGDGGPSFAGAVDHPTWILPGRLAELPLTTVFNGPLGAIGCRLRSQWLSRRIAPGLMARLGLSERVPLTPEGITAEKAVAAIDVAIAARLPLLVFSFHSPSLEAGNTVYVRDAADLAAFYRWWETVLGHLACKGVSATNLDGLVTDIFGDRPRS